METPRVLTGEELSSVQRVTVRKLVEPFQPENFQCRPSSISVYLHLHTMGLQSDELAVSVCQVGKELYHMTLTQFPGQSECGPLGRLVAHSG